MAVEDENGELLFELEHLIAFSVDLEDGRRGLNIENARLSIPHITPETVMYIRNKLTEFLVEYEYE